MHPLPCMARRFTLAGMVAALAALLSALPAGACGMPTQDALNLDGASFVFTATAESGAISSCYDSYEPARVGLVYRGDVPDRVWLHFVPRKSPDPLSVPFEQTGRPAQVRLVYATARTDDSARGGPPTFDVLTVRPASDTAGLGPGHPPGPPLALVIAAAAAAVLILAGAATVVIRRRSAGRRVSASAA